MKTARGRFRASLLVILAAAFGGAMGSLGAAPALPIPVPYESFDDEPYRWVGLVRTDSLGADPTVLGTGLVADQRVVVSAAHVFFVDELLGWNRNRWYFRRAARPEDFWKVDEARRPRAYRTLAGYATAVGRETENPSAFYDALNRDTIALLFYQSVHDGAPAPRLVNGLAGAATFNFVGYPARLAGQPSVELARMYGHVGGQAGTFARWDERDTDMLGHPFELFQTSDLQSGPGGSGGPVFRRENDTWKVAGVLLAAATDHTSVLARSIDAEADALITQAIADASDPDFGQLIWRQEIPNHSRPPLCRADGSIVFMASDSISGSYVEAIDSHGQRQWRTPIDRHLTFGVIERPDGTLVVGDYSLMFVLDGGTGEVQASMFAPGPDGQLAVGAVGEFYSTHTFLGRITRTSPRGVEQWSVTLPLADDDDDFSRELSAVVGRDGTIYVVRANRIHALDPANGAIRWSTARFAQLSNLTLAPSLDGGVFFIADQQAVMLEPDGSVRWSTPVPGAGVNAPVLMGDGRVYVVSGSTEAIHVLGPDGAKQREFPYPHNVATSFTVDAAGAVYVGLPNEVRAYDATGSLLWTHDEGGMVTMAPGKRLVIVGPGGTTLSVLSTAAGRDDNAWQSYVGGPDLARRVAGAMAIAPSLVTTPASKRVVEGYRLELEADAEGSYPLTFEWRRDGELLPDQVGRRLRIASATAADSGNYTVTARNLAGTVTSAPAAITVAEAQFGDQLWTTNLRLESAAAIADDGTVYAVVGIDNPASLLIHYHLVAFAAHGTELWRYDFQVADSESTHIEYSPVVIGDDGRLFVGSASKVWCFSASGSVLWTSYMPSLSSANTPSLALGPGRTVYAMHSGSVRLYDYEGRIGWEQPAPGGINPPGSVRRDGTMIIIRSGSFYRPDGSSGSLPIPLWGGGVLGPDDELAGGAYPSGVTTWDKQWQQISRNTSLEGDAYVRIMLENLEMVCGGTTYNVLPFLGATTRAVGDNGWPFAALQGNRFLGIRDTMVSAYQNTGELLGSFTLLDDGRRQLSSWGTYTVGPQGQFIGGNTLAVYAVTWPLANSPWPSPSGDARNSNRAPGTYALTRDLVFRVDVSGPVKSFEGYATTLQARVFGAGGTMRWRKNGDVLPGATDPNLVFADTQASDAGSYVFEVTTPAGTFASAPYELVVHPPAPAPAGLYVGQWPDGDGYTPYAMTVGTDGRFELIIAGPDGRTARGQLNADGTFAVAGSPPITGRVQNQQLTFTSGPDGDVLPMFAPAAGWAPNGIPAGIYRGRSLGSDSWPGNAIVFADGTVALTPAWPAGQAESVTTAFAGTSRTINVLNDPNIPWSTKLTLEADPEGVLRGTYSGYDAAKPEFNLFWSGRPRTERLANLSTRGYVSPAEPPMIAGFVVSGSTPHTLLLRGAGPGLALVGVQQPLSWARVRLMNQSAVELRRNEGWSAGVDATSVRQAAMRVSAFPFANNSKDAALYATLDAGLYTMFTESADGTAGIALVEAYEDTTISGRGSRLTNLSTRGTLGYGERSLIGGFVIEGTRPKSLLIRVVGPGLLPIMGSGTAVAENPRVEIFAQNASYPMVTNDNWGQALTPDIAAVSARVQAFPLATGSLDAALVLSLPPGIYTAVASSQGFTEGIALLEIYEVDE